MPSAVGSPIWNRCTLTRERFDMGSIFEYVLWRGHDCDGTMPALDVLAGGLAASAPTLAGDGVMVGVPPQGPRDWGEGGRRPPGFHPSWPRSPRRPSPP